MTDLSGSVPDRASVSGRLIPIERPTISSSSSSSSKTAREILLSGRECRNLNAIRLVSATYPAAWQKRKSLGGIKKTEITRKKNPRSVNPNETPVRKLRRHSARSSLWYFTVPTPVPIGSRGFRVSIGYVWERVNNVERGLSNRRIIHALRFSAAPYDVPGRFYGHHGCAVRPVIAWWRQ